MTHLSDIVRRGAARWGDRVALEDWRGARRVTYRDLDLLVRRGAARLRAGGLQSGDRVLLVMDSTSNWPVALLSAFEADLTVVPLPSETPPMLAGLVVHYASIRACIHDETNRAIGDLCPAALSLTVDELSVDAGAVEMPQEPFTNPIAVIVFTSGSTARPRAVTLSHGNLLANLRALMAVRHAEADETLLSVLPPAHLYEMVAGQFAPLAIGARVVYGGKPLPNRLVDAMRTRAVTRVALVPALLDALAREVLDGLASAGHLPASCIRSTPARLAAEFDALAPGAQRAVRAAVRQRIGSSLRTIAVGGAAVDPAWADVLARVGVGLDVGYGLTEAGPLVSMGLAASSPRGSVGKPLPGVEVRIGDDGEVLVRSDAVMQGYAGDPDSTSAALAGGWLHTGDRGTLDEDGFLSITGRLKEAIVTASGDTVYPDEIEPHYASPHFAEHCVVPMPGAEGNDLPTLVVVPVPGATDADIDRAFASLRSTAPPRLRVAAILRRSKPLPRTALGKIRRRLLADALPPAGVAS